jgi:hypothetical protein
MSIEADLFTALKTLVSNRVYPDVAPTGAAMPYITYQQVGGESVTFADATLPDKRNGRFQINVWSATRAEASTLMRTIANTVVTTFKAEPMNEPISTFDLETRSYGSLQHFSIWFVA